MKATVGIWAGTSVTDRRAVRGRPIAEAVEQLESEFWERLRARVEAYKARWPNRPLPIPRQVAPR